MIFIEDPFNWVGMKNSQMFGSCILVSYPHQEIEPIVCPECLGGDRALYSSGLSSPVSKDASLHLKGGHGCTRRLLP